MGNKKKDTELLFPTLLFLMHESWSQRKAAEKGWAKASEEGTISEEVKNDLNYITGYHTIPEDIIATEELDYKNLNYDKEKYFIQWDGKSTSDYLVLSPCFESIYLYNGNRRISLHQLFEETIDNLTPEKMKEKDLLIQLIIAYAIKRAQNGDDRARGKLCQLCLKKAVSIAFSFIESRENSLGVKVDPYGILGNKSSKLGENILPSGLERISEKLINLLLSGDRPEDLLDLIVAKKDWDGFKPLATRKLNSFLIECLEAYLPSILAVWKKLTKRKRGGKRSVEKLGSQAIVLSTLLDPSTWVLRSPEFNKQVFSPKGGKNLIVWLFGHKDYTKGVFWKRFRDWYEGEEITLTIKKKRYIKEEHLLRKNYILEDKIKEIGETTRNETIITKTTADGEEISVCEIVDKTDIREIEFKETQEALKNLLTKYLKTKKFKPRQIEIIILNKIDQMNRKEISEKVGYTEKQVTRIINKFDTLLRNFSAYYKQHANNY